MNTHGLCLMLGSCWAWLQQRLLRHLLLLPCLQPAPRRCLLLASWLWLWLRWWLLWVEAQAQC